MVERLDKGVSDHCPQLLCFESNNTRRGLFKFYNVVADHVDFEQVVREHWGRDYSHNLLRAVWRNCMRLKEPIKKINTQWFVKTKERLEDIRHNLQQVQHLLSGNPSDELLHDEKRLLVELEKWSKIEENIWQQKSKIDWLTLGDANTIFFHVYTKVRQHTNAIHRLVRADVSICVGKHKLSKR